MNIRTEIATIIDERRRELAEKETKLALLFGTLSEKSIEKCLATLHEATPKELATIASLAAEKMRLLNDKTTDTLELRVLSREEKIEFIRKFIETQSQDTNQVQNIINTQNLQTIQPQETQPIPPQLPSPTTTTQNAT